MDSSSSSNKLVFFFLGCILLFTFSDNFVAGDSEKVKLNVYYESLCPFCQDFIVDGLVKIFDSDLQTITDLKLVPFGNARVSDDLTVTCQVLFSSPPCFFIIVFFFFYKRSSLVSVNQFSQCFGIRFYRTF